MVQNRNLFRLTRFLLLKLPYLFRFLALFRAQRKRLLIIKADAIGDYILFRNYIEAVKRSAKFKDYEIDLLGNEIWQDLALSYDSQYISTFHFTKANRLYYKPSAVFKLGWQLFKRNYQTVLNPLSTRTFITDGLAALTAAKQIIGFESDTEGIENKYKVKTDKFYTLKLVLPAAINFEFYRHRFFFENVLDESIALKQPLIKVAQTTKNGIMIFPGAGLKKRGWETEKFIQLIKLLEHNATAIIYLAGGIEEAAVNEYITQQAASARLINITGKTTLTELVQLIAASTLVIANDSSAVHIAAAVQTPSVCITGGGHFNRFVPYPQDLVSGQVCVYEKLECYYCNWKCIFKTETDESFPCISTISVDQVWQAAARLLNVV